MRIRYSILMLLCLVLASASYGAVYTASDSPGPGEFSSIQDAVNLCSPTDSVQILGAFTENVTVATDYITFFGSGEIDGGMGLAFYITSDYVELDGFRIAGIHVVAGSNYHNIINNCFFAGTIQDDCTALLINNWDGNYYYDHTATPTYPVAGGNQVDYNPAFATIAPASATSTLSMGDQVVFDVDYLTNGICAGMAHEAIKIVEYNVTWDATVLDYVSYADGDGMPGNGQYLIDESNVATGTLVVTATSLDDVMTGDGNLGHITLEAINVTCAATTSIAASGTAYTEDQVPTIVPVAFGSTTVTVEDAVAPTVEAFAANNPFGDDFYTSASDLEITTLEVADDVDLHYAWYRFDDAGGWIGIGDLANAAAPAPFVTDDAITAPIVTGGGSLADGAHVLNIMVRDHCGNDGFYDYNFDVDNTAPVFSIALSDDDGCAQAGYADGVVKVLTTGDGTEASMDIAYRLAPAGYTYTGFNPFAASVNVDLTGMTDGLWDFAVMLKDEYGNASGWVYSTITLDQVSGTAALDVPVAGTSLTVAWDATGSSVPGFYAFIITDDMNEATDCSSTNWNTSWASMGSFTFTDNTCGDHTLYIGIMDVAGNIVTASDVYRFDNCAPVVTAVAVVDQDGSDCSDSWTNDVTVEYTFDAFDLNGWVRFGLDGTTWSGWTLLSDISAASETFVVDMSTLPGFVSPANCGDNMIYAQLLDDLNNFSNTDVAGAIHVDCYDPTFTAFNQRDLDYPVAVGGNTIHPSWSNETTVRVIFEGVVESSDFDFVVSEDDFATEVVVNVADADYNSGDDEYSFEFTYVTAITDGTAMTLKGKVVSCGDNESSVMSDGINFDFPTKAGAVISAFDAVTDPVNYLAGVQFSVAATDDFSGVYRMKMYEAGYEGSAAWGGFATPASITLADDGDGDRTVGVYVADRAGNITGPSEATVTVDTEGPMGTFNLVSINADAYSGEPHAYTNTSSCELAVDVPSDCVQMAARNYDKGVGWDTWVYMTPTSPGTPEDVAWIIDYGVNLVFDKVQMGFRDGAGNWEYVEDSIFVDVTAPPAFVALADEGVYFGDGTHCGVWWNNGYADHYFSTAYYLRWGNYPVYEGIFPAQPTNLPGEGFALGAISQQYNAFIMSDDDDPNEDVYRFAIYNYDSAGNVAQNVPGDISGYWAVSTSYIQGDLDFDGGMSFMMSTDEGVGDFARFASAYYAQDNLVPTDPFWDDDCDFSDQFNNQAWPEPDDIINIYDLMDFVLNYTDYPDGWNDKAGVERMFAVDFDWNSGAPKVVPHGPIAIMAELPEYLSAGEEYTVTFTIDDPSQIMGLHLTFDYNSETLEIVNVTKGDMFNTPEKTFFYKKAGNNELLIDCVIFSKDGFASSQIAEVTFRAITDVADFSLNESIMVVRDNNNLDVEAVFNSVVTKTVALPTDFGLGQNYPNPFNPATTIKMALPVASDYKLDIFNIAGQRVHTFTGYSEAGYVTFTWDASDYASGVYFYRMETSDFTATKKMIMIK